MIYPIKTLSQLPLLLKGFRKEKGLTQAAMAERLGITQQSYAYFEANPATATLERLFMVLRLMDVEISLEPSSAGTGTEATPAAKVAGKTPGAMATSTAKPLAVAPATRKESW